MIDDLSWLVVCLCVGVLVVCPIWYAITCWDERAARRALAAQQEAIERARREEYAAYLDQCARETWARRAAIEFALWEANRVVDQFGFPQEWIEGQGWLFSNSAAEQKARLLHRSTLVEKYTAQILGGQQSPIDLLRQQNAYGDAAFAGALALEYARGDQPAHSAAQLTFED